jgi:hypothetical protein
MIHEFTPDNPKHLFAVSLIFLDGTSKVVLGKTRAECLAKTRVISTHRASSLFITTIPYVAVRTADDSIVATLPLTWEGDLGDKFRVFFNNSPVEAKVSTKERTMENFKTTVKEIVSSFIEEKKTDKPLQPMHTYDALFSCACVVAVFGVVLLMISGSTNNQTLLLSRYCL